MAELRFGYASAPHGAWRRACVICCGPWALYPREVLRSLEACRHRWRVGGRALPVGCRRRCRQRLAGLRSVQLIERTANPREMGRRDVRVDLGRAAARVTE